MACNSSFGFIVVEERSSHKQKLYKLGDKIGQDKLIKITRNTATLKNGEREITLKIKETMEGSYFRIHQPREEAATFPDFDPNYKISK